MSRTIHVVTITEWVNTRLAGAESTLTVADLTPEQAFRLGIASLLEQILHATDNYKGFNYLASEVLPAAEQTDGNVLKPNYDNTRRRYHS